jgi:ATP-dependent DNA helicase HFM1/MER3
MQMIGRAVSFEYVYFSFMLTVFQGRPQFGTAYQRASEPLSNIHTDKEGIAIVMCELELEGKYKALAQGKTLLESCLHVNLSEHVNSEIGLGTIVDIESAKEWLHNSFLFQRLQKNPKHYAIGKQEQQTWQERLDEMVTLSVKMLKEGQLVMEVEEGSEQLKSTEYGDIMSKVRPVEDVACPFLLLTFLLALHQAKYSK